ncbi:peroxisomal (S)-2-hydroxy-acid oxidase GLO4 [Citrus sinensis]|nr:peroxisomal (S)-2-hydroxy-acid oxidase GLO4 [Citrus sinensis]
MAAEPVNLNAFQELARLALPKMYYDFYAGGVENQYTLKENMEAFHGITQVKLVSMSNLRNRFRTFKRPFIISPRFWPRILVDVCRIDISTSTLDYKISASIIIAPTGEVATARAAASCNTIMVLSFTSSCSIEEVAASCNANDCTAVEELGRPLINQSHLCSNLEAYAKETMDPSLSWKDIEWLRSITNLPILIKGVLTREDGMIKAPFDDITIKAVEVGVAGIIVSNHGARQLDYTPATISALEEVTINFT